jgi:hypothetical protein
MARWHSCNVLHAGRERKTLWQFATGSGKNALQREEAKLPDEPLPLKAVGKDWHTLFQPKLNVAWLPRDQVFLRVIQLPKSDDPAEIRSMVDLQLEKVSPMPVPHIIWGYEVVPHSGLLEMQTVVVIIVARNQVEAFLGNLEGQGYLADRLELPFFDELRATQITGDGVWLYPGLGSKISSCLVAWWYGGVLQNLALLQLPDSDNRGAALQEQIGQMNWAGELEGWLTSLPVYHLVTDTTAAEAWKPLFLPEQRVEVVAPVPARELAALTAKRAVYNGSTTNLLPPEFAARYRQKFIDRLWMRGLGAVLMLYILSVVVYYGFVKVADFRYSSLKGDLKDTSIQYTNTIQLREKVRVLQDQLDLQYAALDCYKAVAELLPPEITLDSFNFERGRRLTLIGTAPGDDVPKVQGFFDAMRKFETKPGEPLFSKVELLRINPRQGNDKSWSFVCDLKRADTE